MINHQTYLGLLREFAVLLVKPENQKYTQSNNVLDYTELIVDYIAFMVDHTHEVEPDHPQRILFVHNELEYALGSSGNTELEKLRSFLQDHGYTCLITHALQEINFIIAAPTFDLVIILD